MQRYYRHLLGIYIIDEPITGIHMSDIACILIIIYGLLNKGNAVLS